MKTMKLKIPDSVNETDVKMQLAAQLFERGVMSSGQAADLVGISKKQFLERVGEYGVTIFGETANEIEKLVDE